MDRRRSPRLEISLRCVVTLSGIRQDVLVGTTQNISRSDVLIALDPDFPWGNLPCVGDSLTVEIDLPENHSFGKKCMSCKATVVRVLNGENGDAHLALRISKMKFQASGRQFSQADLMKAGGGRHMLM